MANIDERLMGNTLRPEQEGEAARKFKNNKFDETWKNRLNEVRQRAKSGGLQKSFIGKKLAQKAREKMSQGSNKIFVVLLLIALMVDLLEYLDFGIFTSFINMGVYAITITAGFIAWFFKNNNNKYSIFNLLKGQLWKYLIMPLFEMIPLINVLPFWTGTVVMMWVKVSYERKKMIGKNEETGKAPSKFSVKTENQIA
jgi:hypothetical protein